MTESVANAFSVARAWISPRNDWHLDIREAIMLAYPTQGKSVSGRLDKSIHSAVSNGVTIADIIYAVWVTGIFVTITYIKLLKNSFT